MGGVECLEQGFLDQILRFGFVPAEQPGGTKQAIAVDVHQLPEIQSRWTSRGGIVPEISHILLVPETDERFNRPQGINLHAASAAAVRTGVAGATERGREGKSAAHPCSGNPSSRA